MTMPDILNWSVVASIASAISAIAAAVSAYLSFKSIKSSAVAAKEQRASQAIINYVDWSLKYPKHSTDKKSETYEWYVIAVLEMVREVLAAYPNDARRRSQMKLQLSFHSEQLAIWNEQFPDDVNDYGNEVALIVQEVLKEALETPLNEKPQRAKARKTLVS
jgi:hypothetical protein